MLAAVVSFACASIIGWILHPEYLSLPIFDRFMVAGFSFYYAVLGFLAASALLLLIMRLDVRFWIDQVVPSVLILNIFGRIGCILAGCCYGADISIFGLTFAFPAPGLEALAALIMLVVFSKKIKQHRAFWYLAYYSFLRFLLEFTRVDERGTLLIDWLSPAQVTSIVIWIGLAVYFAIVMFALRKKPFEQYNEFEIKNKIASQVFKPKRHRGLKRLLAFVLVGTFALAIWNPLQITAIDSAKYTILSVFDRVGATRSQVVTIAEGNSTSVQRLDQRYVPSKEEALTIIQNADPDIKGSFDFHRQEQLSSGNQLFTFNQEYRGKPIFNSGRQIVVGPDNTANYMTGETIPLFETSSSHTGNTGRSGSQAIKDIFGETITVRTTTEGYYYDPAALMENPMRNVDQIAFELPNGTSLSALVDRGSGDIITLAPDEQTANYNMALSNIMQATEAFLSEDEINSAAVSQDLQALNRAFEIISRNRNIDNEAFADIVASSLSVAQGLASPNLPLYREILLEESKSYYINNGQSERVAQRNANVFDRALRQAGIRQVEDQSTIAVAMADTAVRTKGSVNFPGDGNAMILSADAGRALTFSISVTAPVIVTVMDETNRPVLSMPVETEQTFRLYPINDNETFHVVISDNTLAPGLGDYSIFIQPDRAVEQQERVPSYITTKLRQIESAYNAGSVSRFVALMYFLDGAENSLTSTVGMTALASLSSFTMSNCYSCVGLDEELLDGDKMLIAQLLFQNKTLPDQIASALRDTYMTMRYERYVEHENGAYVKAALEIGMLDRPPILKDTIYMELRNISYEKIVEQAIQGTGIQNDTLRKAVPRLFSGYFICDDLNSERVRRGLGVSDEEFAQDTAKAFNLYDYWENTTIRAGIRSIEQKKFLRSNVERIGLWSVEELDAFEEFTLHYNIGLLKNEIRALEWENNFYASVPDIIAGSKEVLDIGGMLIGLFVGNPLPAIIYLMEKVAENFGDARVFFDAEGAFLDAILDDMRANALIKIQENKAIIAAIHELLRKMDPNYEYEIETTTQTTVKDNTPSPLTETDYAEIFSSDFSSDSGCYWKLAYWAALASWDTYGDEYEAMRRLGFEDIQSIDDLLGDEVKAVYGMKKLEKPINGRNYIVMVAFRGTVGGFISDNMFNNIDVLRPVTWYEQPRTIPSTSYQAGMTISEYSELPWRTVHRGFFDYTRKFIEHNGLDRNRYWFYYGAEKKELRPDDCLFIITGHSLGGAMAELYALRLNELGLVAVNNIVCYGIASPHNVNVLMREYCRDLGMGDRIHKLYHVRDLTPTNTSKHFNFHSLSQHIESFGRSGTPHATRYHGKDTYVPYILERIN